MFGCLPRRRFDLGRLFQPFRKWRIREEARAERAGVHDAHASCFEIWNRFVRKARVLERVLVIAQDTIDFRLVADEPEDLLRIPAEAYEAHLALPLNFAKR